MSKASFRRATLKTCSMVHALVMFALFIGPVVAVGAGRNTDEATFFRRYLLAPIIVFLVVTALGVINFAVAELVRKLFPDDTP